jgi:hypothetical protein
METFQGVFERRGGFDHVRLYRALGGGWEIAE